MWAWDVPKLVLTPAGGGLDTGALAEGPRCPELFLSCCQLGLGPKVSGDRAPAWWVTVFATAGQFVLVLELGVIP